MIFIGADSARQGVFPSRPARRTTPSSRYQRGASANMLMQEETRILQRCHCPVLLSLTSTPRIGLCTPRVPGMPNCDSLTAVHSSLTAPRVMSIPLIAPRADLRSVVLTRLSRQRSFRPCQNHATTWQLKSPALFQPQQQSSPFPSSCLLAPGRLSRPRLKIQVVTTACDEAPQVGGRSERLLASVCFAATAPPVPA